MLAIVPIVHAFIYDLVFWLVFFNQTMIYKLIKTLIEMIIEKKNRIDQCIEMKFYILYLLSLWEITL